MFLCPAARCFDYDDNDDYSNSNNDDYSNSNGNSNSNSNSAYDSAYTHYYKD